MVKIISSLFFGCLFVLTAASGVADNASVQSDLSATATESFQIQNKKFGDLLRPEGANAAVGTRIVLYSAEPWKCMTWKLQPAGESVYHVQNHFTSKTFSVKAEAGGKNVVQTAFAREPGGRPAWRFTKLADGLYRISEEKSGDVLTAVSDDGGTVRIVVASWQDKPEQKWQLNKINPAELTM